MRRILPFLAVCFLCIGVADAAVRAANSNARGAGVTQSRNITTRGGATTTESRKSDQSGRTVTTRSSATPQRATVSRQTTPTSTSHATTARTTKSATRTVSSATNTNSSRIAVKPAPNTKSTRTATNTKKTNVSRAAVTSQTFGSGYNSCRDAYFTCMDQFCANANDTYRRCICSSRLDEIKAKQRALDNASEQLQNFQDLNIDAIPKTGAEVKAMLTASRGETAAATTQDTSNSAKQLAGINAVLTTTKAKALSTTGTLDIAGDINAIWATTDLASGANIANLTGEALFNAVHSQCSDMVSSRCESQSILNMVVTAYGMYIENDCSLLLNALDKQKNITNTTIRDAEREMQNARLENYNAHNSTSINDCVANVRADITADTACGENYVHCLDISGLYLNKVTGEPIYTANFYQLETMVSLSGDLLTNQTNRMLVSELNNKRVYAEGSLSTCQDLADEVWDEFLRQAITEIYQGQQSRVRQVKEECLDVVNKCYDSQTASLRDFSNTKEQLVLGSQLELSEQLCREKLSTCSNLYGGGSAGMQQLIDTMLYGVTSQKISQNCLTTLQEYAQSICSVSSNDTLHTYPYGCRVYAPGEQKYAKNWDCQKQTLNRRQVESLATQILDLTDLRPKYQEDRHGGYDCNTYDTQGNPVRKSIRYIQCNNNSYLSDCGGETSTYWGSALSGSDIQAGNRCIPCSEDFLQEYSCPGNTWCPIKRNADSEGCSDYVGSLYQTIVSYAIQTCMRPSETSTTSENTTPISDDVLQDVNKTMDSIRTAMSASLKTECERLGGYWVATPYEEPAEGQENTSANNLTVFQRFYEETAANKKWGYCAHPDAANTYYGNNSGS